MISSMKFDEGRTFNKSFRSREHISFNLSVRVCVRASVRPSVQFVFKIVFCNFVYGFLIKIADPHYCSCPNYLHM